MNLDVLAASVPLLSIALVMVFFTVVVIGQNVKSRRRNRKP